MSLRWPLVEIPNTGFSAQTALHTLTAGAGGSAEHVPPDDCEVVQALLVPVSCKERSGGRKESRRNGLVDMWHK